MKVAALSFDIGWVQHDHEHNQTVLKWISERIWPDTDHQVQGPALCMVLTTPDRIVSAVALHNYMPDYGTIEVTGASDDKRMTRGVLWAIYDTVFNKLNCQMAVHRNTDGDPINRMCLAYGFTPHKIENMRGRGKAEIIMTLTSDAWRANGFHKENL